MVRKARFLFLAMSLIAAACSSASEDATDTSNAALSEYGGVVQNGTKVETDNTITPTQSAKTRVVGYLPKTDVASAATQLLRVGRWTEMKNQEGSRIFPAASITSDSTHGGVRTMTANVTLDGDISLELGITATPDPASGRVNVHVVNKTGYSVFFVGQVLAPGKLTLDVALVPFTTGVIVDATMRVKLDQFEERAPGITANLPGMFDWLLATVPHVAINDAGPSDGGPSDAGHSASDAGSADGGHSAGDAGPSDGGHAEAGH